jgi:hypothetical protein
MLWLADPLELRLGAGGEKCFPSFARNSSPGFGNSQGQTLRAATTDAYFSGVMITTGNSRSVNI